MSNLVSAFDFDHIHSLWDISVTIPMLTSHWPDYTLLSLPVLPEPHQDSSGNWDASFICVAEYGHLGPPIPYGPENEAFDPSTLSEDGLKAVRGYLTEGRYPTFEINSYALTNPGLNASDFTVSKATATHSDKKQRWVIHQIGGTAVDGGKGAGSFALESALDGRYIKSHTSLGARAPAETFTIEDLGNGKGYTWSRRTGSFLPSIQVVGLILSEKQRASRFSASLTSLEQS